MKKGTGFDDYLEGKGEYQVIYDIIKNGEFSNNAHLDHYELEKIVQKAILIGKHEFDEGIATERCAGNFKEEVFRSEWKRHNDPFGIGSPHGYLQTMLKGLCENPIGIGRQGKLKDFDYVVSGRERTIVATVIQWLGTNVGWEFLNKCVDRMGYKLEKKHK